MKSLIASIFLLMGVSASAADLYVSPNGNDANPGTAEQPLASLRSARDAIRALKAKNAAAQPITVHVADGEYSFTEPLVLEPADSGTADAPIVYQAAPGAHPVLSGGRRLQGWQPGENGIWTLKIPDVATGKWYFEQLFVNSQRATRARTPNKLYFYLQDVHETPLDDAAKSDDKRKRGHAHQMVQMYAADAEQAFARLRPEDRKDVQLVVYHNWDNTRRFLDDIDTAHGVLTTTGEALKPWNPWKRNSHYILENYLGALDAPGEWFLSRDGMLYYMPRPGEDMTKADVVAPVAEKFLVMTGEPAAGKFVEHVAFRGLAFRHSQQLTPPGGFEAAQAAAPIDAVVMADGAKHITLEDCEIGHIGIYAVWFRKGCTDCAVRRCYIHDFGAGGIRIGEAKIPKNDAEATSRIEIDNNIVRDGGWIFPCAVGIWVGQSGDNRVTHNEIANLFYTGISAGWTWGYADGRAKRNTFSFNHVHHLGGRLLSDMGGIYTLGLSEGTVISNNVFHDIYAYSYGGWGLYTDEGSTGLLLENNLAYRTKTGGFHQHYGKENVLRNNIFALNIEQQLQATRVEDHLSFTLEDNIVYYDGGKVLAGPWDKIRFAGGNNLFWQAGGKPVDFLGQTLADWQAKGHEKGSQTADPKFVDPEHGDFHLAADSPAIAMGFNPFDYTQAGVYGDASWVQKAREATYSEPELPPPLPSSTAH
jgi:hypothetical protein